MIPFIFKTKHIFATALYLLSSLCFAAESGISSKTIPQQPDYVNISIDNVVVDTNSLTQITKQLSNGIESLSNAIERLSTSDTAFSQQDRETLIAATESVKNASQALSKLSQQLPAAIQGLTRELPEVLKNTQPQIAAISKSIQNASKAAISINESFPDTLLHGQKIVSEITTDVMQKVTLYIGLILLLFALVIAALIYIVYRTSILPIASGLNDLRAVPAQLSEMSAYMHDTSENLLSLEELQNTRRRRTRVRR